MQAVSGSVPTFFARRATGLVRELGTFDAFNLCFAAIVVPIGATQAFLFAPALFPGANLVISFLIATIMALCFGMVYMYFAASMPRSGGDYVWVSRTLHPLLGFTVNVVLTFVPLSWVALDAALQIGYFAPSIAYLMGVKNFSLTQGQEFWIGTAINAFFFAVMLGGLRRIARLMLVLFVVVQIGTLVWIILMLGQPHSAFVNAFNTASGTDYASFMSQATKGGYVTAAATGATLLGVIYAFQFFVGFNWTGYFAGEVKNVTRTVVISILGTLVVTAIVYTVASAAFYKYYGFDFAGAAVSWFNNGASTYPLNFPPYIANLAYFLSDNVIIRWLIPITFLISVLWAIPVLLIVASRNILAWSFDGLIPSWVSRVNERWNVPINSQLVVALAVEVLLLLEIYTQFWAWLINWIAVMALAFLVVCIAAVVFPYRRPDVFKASPAFVQRRIGGVPVMSVFGVLGAIAELILIGIALSTPAIGGAVTWNSLLYAAVVPAAAIVYFLIWRAVKSRQGINLSYLATEIPPE